MIIYKDPVGFHENVLDVFQVIALKWPFLRKCCRIYVLVKQRYRKIKKKHFCISLVKTRPNMYLATSKRSVEHLTQVRVKSPDMGQIFKLSLGGYQIPILTLLDERHTVVFFRRRQSAKGAKPEFNNR